MVIACGGGSQDASQQAQQPQQPYPQQPYPQQQQQAYPQQQQQFPQQQPQQQTFPQQQQQPQPQALPQPSPTPVAPAAGGGTMATPGPLALPCSNDGGCGLGRCNTAAGKCAFPCLGPADCNSTSSCNTMTGFCLPGGH
ncbi:MAG: hypothetical protein ABIP89_25475 [Polyangiaceae bacterium]